jgi:hypothetical protein
MANSMFQGPVPTNEPVADYSPRILAQGGLVAALNQLAEKQIEIRLIIGGEEVRTGNIGEAVMPHDHVLATYHIAGEAEVRRAKSPGRTRAAFPGKAGRGPTQYRQHPHLPAPGRDERRDHARPEQNSAPVRDRRRCRADHLCLSRAGMGRDVAPGRHDLTLRPDRRRVRPGPFGSAEGAATAAPRGRQLLINDKPTGAVVGLPPFGGSRASGTNDKAGSALNLERGVTPRTIKENFCPPTDYRYPYMGLDSDWSSRALAVEARIHDPCHRLGVQHTAAGAGDALCRSRGVSKHVAIVDIEHIDVWLPRQPVSHLL